MDDADRGVREEQVRFPTLRKTAEEVNREYNRSQSERECTGLSHAIDTEGGCACGFFIDGEPSGTFPFVPNRRTRRTLGGVTKRQPYVMSDEDRKRLEEERDREQSRREIRERARLSRREERDREPPVTVQLLVQAEDQATEEG